MTPVEGLTVAGHFIPGNTTVVAPLYSIHRRKCLFFRLKFERQIEPIALEASHAYPKLMMGS